MILKCPIHFVRPFRIVIAVTMLFSMCTLMYAQKPGMIIRISEIEVHSQYLEEYKAILQYEAEASVRLEEGVIAIFPMFQRDNPTQIRILEMYADEQAYQSHLKTEHFLKYKTKTLHMVKSLELIDMNTIDPETMNIIFSKLGNSNGTVQKKYQARPPEPVKISKDAFEKSNETVSR